MDSGGVGSLKKWGEVRFRAELARKLGVLMDHVTQVLRSLLLYSFTTKAVFIGAVSPSAAHTNQGPHRGLSCL